MSGADLEYQVMLARANREMSDRLDAARLEQLGDSENLDIFHLVNDGRLSEEALSALIDDHVPVTVNLKLAAPPSGSNDTTAVQAALTALDAAGGGLLRVPRGTWTFTGSTGLTLTNTTNPILIDAEDGAVFDFSNSTAATALTLGGSQGTSAALGGNVSRSATALTCAAVAAAVTQGDIILITSTVDWESFTGQKQGEFSEVLSVSGSTINLKDGLFDTYTAATTTITKINAPTVSITGRLKVIRNSNQKGIEINNARNVLVSGLDMTGARERLLYLNYCYMVSVAHCTGRDFWYSGTGTSYGLVIAASQHIREIANDFRGGRHAISHGGFVPCRDIQIIGGTFDNYQPSGQKSVDFHADCENIKILGATILNGLNSQASNLYVGAGTTIKTVYATPAVEIGPARSCDYIKFLGVDIESATGQDGIVYIARNGANATTLGVLEIDATIRSGGNGVDIFPANSTHTGATIDRVSLRGDWYTSSVYANLTSSVSGAAEVTINTLECDARRWRSNGGNSVTMVGAKTGKATFRGTYSTGKNGGSVFSLDKFSDITIEDFVMEGTNTPYRSLFTNTGTLVMRDGLIDGASSAGGINAGSGPAEALISNVRKVNTTGNPLLPARHYESINGIGNVVTYAAAAPVAGAWNVGDKCWYTTPTAGAAPGAVCVTAGTPGTWKAMANLA